MADLEGSRYLRLQKEIRNPDLTCYVCVQINSRRPEWKQQGDTKACFLCNNEYCDMHKSKTIPNTCEINHITYCGKANHKARHRPIQIFTTIEEREAWIAQKGEEYAAGSSQSRVGEKV